MLAAMYTNGGGQYAIIAIMVVGAIALAIYGFLASMRREEEEARTSRVNKRAGSYKSLVRTVNKPYDWENEKN